MVEFYIFLNELRSVLHVFMFQYARSEEWTTLCDALGARLDAGHQVQAATLCYICAGNIERTVDIWSRTLISKKGGPDFVDVLQVSLRATHNFLTSILNSSHSDLQYLVLVKKL